MFGSCLFVSTLISQGARQTPPGLCTVHAALCEGVHPVLAILVRGKDFDVWTALSSVPKAVRFASETAHPKDSILIFIIGTISKNDSKNTSYKKTANG